MTTPAIVTVGNDNEQYVLTASRVQSEQPLSNPQFSYKYTQTKPDGTSSEYDLGDGDSGLPYGITRLAEYQGLYVNTYKSYNDRIQAMRRMGATDANDATRVSIIEWARDNGHDRDMVNDLLNHLSMDEWCNKWDVTVEYGYGESFTVLGVEAEDEEEAIDAVKEEMNIKVNVVVEYTGSDDCDGSIDTEEDDSDWVWESLSFSASPAE